jgi:heavy metal translocating P-type ATPase
MAFAALVAGQSMILGLAVNLSPPAPAVRTTLHAALAASAVVAFLLVGLPLARTALGAAARGRIVFEQLFLVGILGAFGASVVSSLTGAGHVYYEVVAILLAIYTFGRVIGDRRRAAALDSARALGEEFDTCERVEADGSIASVAVREIRADDIVLVPAGAGVPIDGEVVEGEAFVNEAALTGEPFPVSKRAGDPVLAGSHSVDGALRVRATVAGDARRLDATLARVRAAQAQPSHLEREADRIVAWFLPTVLAVAAGTFWFWTARAGWTTGLFNALAVVLVACPCSMGLATPIGVWSALADLARRGLVANTSDLVERLAAVRLAVFDKTGTLSDGQLEIEDCACVPDVDRGTLLAEIAAVEAASGHPIARAFRRHASALRAENVRVIPGVGIEGSVNGALLRIGRDASLPPSSLQALLVLRDGVPVATITLRERLRDSAREVISELETMGVECAVLTGDREESAAAHGLANVHAGLSPVEKAELLRALAGRHRALFVGDGVNDGPALAEAHASLSLADGSGVARDVAMGEVRDLRAIPFALARCRAAVDAIRRNLLFAATYNLVGISLAAAGVLHPVAAALLMLASSFTVSWSALRRPAIRISVPSAPALPSPAAVHA